MTNPEPFRIYLEEVRQKLATGMAKEHAYRGALEDLLQAAGDELNEWLQYGDLLLLRRERRERMEQREEAQR